MSVYFAPGCALSLYKRELADKINDFMRSNTADIKIADKCCRNAPVFEKNDIIYNICPGCNARYEKSSDGSLTQSIWLYIAKSDFPFPQYDGLTLAVHDPCPFRRDTQVQNAVRLILRRMNINVIDIEKSRAKSMCCGGSFSADKAEAQAKKRISDFTDTSVAVYCISCMNNLSYAGGKVYHLLDLLYQQTSAPLTHTGQEWRELINKYIEEH